MVAVCGKQNMSIHAYVCVAFGRGRVTDVHTALALETKANVAGRRLSQDAPKTGKANRVERDRCPLDPVLPFWHKPLSEG